MQKFQLAQVLTDERMMAHEDAVVALDQLDELDLALQGFGFFEANIDTVVDDGDSEYCVRVSDEENAVRGM